VAVLVLSVAGFVLALVAVWIALWQVRDARRVSKLQGDITALEAFLAIELAGSRDKEVLKTWIKLIIERAQQLGSTEILKQIGNRLPGGESR